MLSLGGGTSKAFVLAGNPDLYSQKLKLVQIIFNKTQSSHLIGRTGLQLLRHDCRERRQQSPFAVRPRQFSA